MRDTMLQMRRFLPLLALTLFAAVACDGSADDGQVIVDIHQAPDVQADVQADVPVPVDVPVEPDVQPDIPAPVDIPVDSGPEICIPGRSCDDGDPCTYDDRCDQEGDCAGEPYSCSDGRACTEDACDGFGDCIYTVVEGKCLIDGNCLDDGDLAPHNTCLSCDATEQPTSWVLLSSGACDDGDPCTLGDSCSEGGCVPGAELLVCDDDNPCTDDTCSAGGGCVFSYNLDGCDDGNPCTGPDVCTLGECAGRPIDCDDDNPCTSDSCTVEAGCTHTAIPAECDDDNICTLGDRCVQGECVGGFEALDCNDDNPCTYDVCDPYAGCLHANNRVACSDGNVCTVDDRCSAGACIPGEPTLCNDFNECTDDFCDSQTGCAYQLNDNPCCEGGHNICDDGNPCTTDSCNLDTGGCVYEFNTSPCNDGNACTTADTCFAGECVGTESSCNDFNECTEDACDVDTGCVYTFLSGDCDDGSACTEGDHCDFGSCVGQAIDCNDGQLCTDDYCDDVTGCQNPYNSASCDDGDACTTNDHCALGSCVGDPNPCDEGGMCQVGTCVRPFGCQYSPGTGMGCDDGIDCTINDTCYDGVCIGDDSECVCEVPPGPAAIVISLAIGTSGHPGQGLDVDDNPNTCSPPGQCSEGIDNAFAGVANLANPYIVEAIQDGDLALLFQHANIVTDNSTPYTFNGWTGDPEVEGCAFMTSTCSFLVDDSMFDEECNPMVFLGGATTDGTNFRAGGVGSNFLFEIPLLEGVPLTLELYNATVEGTMTMSGGRITSMSGILAGAVPKAVIQAALEAVPPEELPINPDFLMSMINQLINDDIDVDGDGNLDAASLAIVFEAREASIAGVQQ